MSASHHEYSESEADAILKRAIDLQASQDSSKLKNELGSGMTLDQLYRSAAEIGVDPSLVRKAAEEVAGRKVVSTKTVPGAPTVIERDFLTTITEADFPALLEHLRAATKSSGSAQVIGGTLEWTAMLMAQREMIHVVVIPSYDSTTVRIRSTNPFAQIPFRTPLYFIPFIVLMAIIPLLMFGGGLGFWRAAFPGLIPFVIIIPVILVMPGAVSGRFSRSRSGAPKGNELMESIGEWLRTRAR